MEAIAFLGLLKIFSKLTAAECRSYTCLLGKTAVVTEGSTGIGYETAAALASRGCRVIVTDAARNDQVVERIKSKTGNEDVVHKTLDTASFQSIRDFAADVNQNEKRLDFLISNTGRGGYGGIYTVDGLLKTMQVNHFGPFLLIYLLTKLLKKTEDSRIVMASSICAYFHKLETVEDMKLPPKWTRPVKHNTVEFNNSNLCSMVSAFCFAKKLQTSGVMCNCFHPGFVDSGDAQENLMNLRSNSLDVLLVKHTLLHLLHVYGKTPREGAQTSLYCALSSKLNVTGRFFVDMREFLPPPKAQIDAFRWDLWKETERIVGIKDDEKL